ncbi:hypothetical protein DPMN_180124 [Dreissena polymorpha]|uniref:Uncharacterized protein n=1 Tax=Dreissena polymorpha TaxID=45954 RepID=A0A9D4IMU6_DREPO|nr:hypothetical protein DPMN_180124 [Dreissena polymorpha]
MLINKAIHSPERSQVIQYLPNIKLNLDIVQTNNLFHDDWAKNRYYSTDRNHFRTQNWAKNVTSRVFTYINKTNVLTNFHDDWAIIATSRVFTRKTAPPPPGSHVIQLTGTFFELNSHIKETNAKNVTSRVFTCFHYIHIEKNYAPPTGSNVFSPIWTIFELIRDINKTNVFTHIHDDWAKIVTSIVFTRKTAPPTGGHVFQPTDGQTTDKDQSQKLT